MSDLVIWVIDDDPIDLKLTKRALSKLTLDCEVECASTLEELANAARPDAILLDWNMPKYPNGALIPTLRSTQPNTPIFILSGTKPDAHARLALELGAVMFLEKQFTMLAQVELLEHAFEQLATSN